MQKKPNRLFIITNNTHYQVIKNYINDHPFGHNYIILTITPFKDYRRFIDEVRENTSFIFLEVILNNQGKPFLQTYFDILKNVIKVKNIQLASFNFENVIFSNYNSWLQHLILRQSKIIKPILISDGVAIFKYIKLRHVTSKAPLNCNKILRKRIFKIKPYPHLHFYSPVEVETSENDSLETFKFYKDAEREIDKNLIFFVDSPLVERRMISLEKKIKYLKKLKLRFEDKRFVYFSHRRETNDNLENYKFLGEIKKDSIPFEERLNKIDKLPFMIISFISSILINLPAVYPEIEFVFQPLEEEDIIDSAFKEKYFDLLDDFRRVKSSNLNPIDRHS